MKERNFGGINIPNPFQHGASVGVKQVVADVAIDTLQVFTITRVIRNAQGKVIFRKEEPIGQAQVEDLQESGAVLKIISRVPCAPDIKAGCLVKRR